MGDSYKGKVRTTQPGNSNKFYLRTTGGGYNPCILGNLKNPYNKRPTTYSVLPNCVGYAYGRYLEYHGLTKAPLPTCNAKDWYSTAKSAGFRCSGTPSAGAVVCFKGTRYGHVAFVERVEKNGDLLISESNWGHQIFRTLTIRKAGGYAYSGTLKLVGFIAPPAAKVQPVTYMTTDKLNIRAGAGTTYAVVGQYQKGAKIKVTTTKTAGGQSWGRTDKGWVCLKYAKKVVK